MTFSQSVGPFKPTISQRFAAALEKYLAAELHGKQKDVADALGFSPSRFNNIVSGRRRSDEDLRREVCRILHLDYDEFIGISGKARVTDERLEEFITLYSQYGSPGFLQNCIKRLLEIKRITEEE